MSINVQRALQEYELFNVSKELLLIHEIEVGLINCTWKVSIVGNGTEYILQKINTNVFPFPDKIDENIRKLELFVKQNHPESCFIELIPLSSRSEGTLLTLYSSDDVDNNTSGAYRVMKFIPYSYVLKTVKSPTIAYEAAKEFAKFHKLFQDFPSEQLHITIPNFHNLSARYEAFQIAIEYASKDAISRLALAQPLIEQLASMNDILTTYEHIIHEKILPLRVIHHDTKISNILFHTETHQGDMFRSYLPTSNEEHTNLQDVTVRIEYFTEIIRGYLEEMHTSLTSQEYEYLIYAGEFMIYMQCLRFLTDYLKGDRYFKITHPMHNYDRARNQLQLLSSYREQAPVMKEIVQQCISQIHNKDDEIIIE